MRWWYRVQRMAKLRHVLAVAASIGTGLAASCGPATVDAPPPKVATKTKASTSASTDKPTGRPAPVPATAIGQFGAGTFGPRVVRNGKQSIVVSAQRSTSGRRWMAQALDETGAPRGDARHEIAEAPEDTSSWDVKPVGDGFVLAWTRPTDGGQQLLSVSLAADGSARGTPTTLARSGDDLVAVVIVPLTGGGPSALLTWGEQTTAKGATIATGTLLAFGLDALGRAITQTPAKLFEHLSAWQVTPLPNGGAAVAIIERNLKAATSANPEQAPRSAKIAQLTSSTKGLAVSDAVVLTPDETALPDVRVVSTGPGRVLAVWEDRRELDTHLFAQSIDVSGPKPKLLGVAHRAAPPRGDQSLTALVATKLGPVLVWEAFHPRPPHEPRRRFELVRLSDTGEASTTPRAIWYPYEEQEPEVVTIQGGAEPGEDVVLLTYGEACLDPLGNGAPTCDGIRPWLLRFSGPTLVPTQADMIDVGQVAGGDVLHAFDLSCNVATCDMLVDGPGDPATVAMAHVGHKPPPPGARWVYIDVIEPASTPPRLEGATTLARESQFAGLHAVRTTSGGSGAALVAWITYAADDDLETEPPPVVITNEGKGKKPPKKPPKAKKGEGGAKVAVRLVDAAGEPLAPIVTISERALSKGDVAIAAGEGAKDGAIVAYVSRAEGDEEVYVARIDGSGKKAGKSSRITHAEGSASDVALVALPEGGYLLAWVDGRKDVNSVYAVRLDKAGAKVGTEVKIGGGAGGDVSDLVLATNGIGSAGARVVASWSDARDDLQTGFGDIYVAIVSGKDPSKVIVSERALQKSKLHSHNPVVSTRPDGSTVFAWMEDDPQATEILELTGKPDWGAYVARLDPSGGVALSATQLAIDPQLGKGVVSGVALDCSGTSAASPCRLALAWSDRQGIAVLGSALPASGALPAARSIWAYVSAPTQEVAPALVGSAVYLCEDGLEKDDGRVRRLAVAW
jgi:hypothetical protein